MGRRIGTTGVPEMARSPKRVTLPRFKIGRPADRLRPRRLKQTLITAKPRAIGRGFVCHGEGLIEKVAKGF